MVHFECITSRLPPVVVDMEYLLHAGAEEAGQPDGEWQGGRVALGLDGVDGLP
jgi:hypothetical protein